jgi:hypothetical protein
MSSIMSRLRYGLGATGIIPYVGWQTAPSLVEGCHMTNGLFPVASGNDARNPNTRAPKLTTT